MYVYRCPECQGKAGGVMLRTEAHPLYCVSHDPPVLLLRVPDSAKVLLPLDAPSGPPAIVIPAKVEALKEAGILTPETQHALDWLWRHRASNGMAEAFLLVGGRRSIDLAAFARLMREQRA